MVERNIKVKVSVKDNASRGLGGFKKALIGVAVAFTAIVLAGKKFASIVSTLIQKANIQEKVEKQVAAVIKSTGGAAGLAAKEIFAMASEMQRLTTFADEVVIQAQALLLTFTSIGRDVFPRAISVIGDMAQLMDQDLKQTVIQVGKALNDPILGVTALSRVGVQFTETQKETIRTMVEANKVMDAQALILTELEKEFGGISIAMANTFGGAVIQARNALSDIGEALAFAITKSEAMVFIVQALRDSFFDLNATLLENQDKMVGVVNSLAGQFLFLAEAAVKVAEAITFLVNLQFSKFDKLTKLLSPAGEELTNLSGITEGLFLRLKELDDAIDDLQLRQFGVMKDDVEGAFQALTPMAAEIKSFSDAVAATGIVLDVEIQQRLQSIRESILAMARVEHLLPPEVIEANNVLLGKLTAELEKMGVELGDLAGKFNLVTKKSKDMSQEIRIATQISSRLFDTIVTGARNGAENLGQMMKQFIRNLTIAIGKALLLKAITSAFAGTKFGSFFGFQKGGLVPNIPKMQHGGIVPGSGRGDRVPALLEPGELVLPRELTNALTGLLTTRSAGTFNLIFQRNQPEASEIINLLNEAVEKSGHRLVASELAK